MGTKMNMVISKPKLWKLVIAVLGIIFIVNLLVFINELRGHEPYITEASSMEYSVRRNDYIDLIESVKNNKVAQEQTVADASEYEALAYFYEALVNYRMYETSDMEKAAVYKEKMDRYASELTSDYMIERKNYLLDKVK